MMKEIDAVLQDLNGIRGITMEPEYRAGAFRKEFRSAPASVRQKG